MRYKICDICEINRENLSKNDRWEYINYLDTSNLNEGIINEIQYLVVGKDKVPSRAKRKVKENDILISTVRPNQKHYGIIKKTVNNMIVSTGFAVLTPNSETVNPEYLYRFLTQDSITNYLQAVAETSTSAYPSIKPSVIGELEIDLPPLEEQNAIANILSTLDEKIEVNNKINKTLEKMAQTIFKHWFVDFEFPNENGEPYKSSGGEMVESELGMIPKGWEVVELGELFEDFIGGEWGKEKEDEKHTISVICIRGTDIPKLKKGNKGNIPTRFIKEKAFKKKRLKTGDIVIEISGGSPTQSTGRATYISKEVINRFNDRVVCTNFCRALRPKKTIFTELAYYFIEKLYKENVFFQYENGTTGIKNLDLNNVLSNEKLAIPKDMVIIEEFSKIINTISKKIQKNGIESEKLAEIRDTLLPKLMSGEIRVPIDN